MKQAILDKIKAYDKIMLFRHVRIDGDCVGSSKGLQEILRLSFPGKQILLVDEETSDYLAFLSGSEDAPVPDSWYPDALGIALDTANASRISNPRHALCKELIKIDHHLEDEAGRYGTLSWVEPRRSSVSEMIAEFYATCKNELRINARAATLLYTGMVTDSGRFQFDSVTGDTLRLGGMLLDIMLEAGVDTQWLHANLNLKDKAEFPFTAYVLDHIQYTPNGVASIYVSEETQKRFGLTQEAASNALNVLSGIRDCLCWIAFIENTRDHTVRVRIRSRFANINPLAVRYGGGGHIHASAATIASIEQALQLLEDADVIIRDYKATHEGWL